MHFKWFMWTSVSGLTLLTLDWKCEVNCRDDIHNSTQDEVSYVTTSFIERAGLLFKYSQVTPAAWQADKLHSDTALKLIQESVCSSF